MGPITLSFPHEMLDFSHREAVGKKGGFLILSTNLKGSPIYQWLGWAVLSAPETDMGMQKGHTPEPFWYST